MADGCPQCLSENQARLDAARLGQPEAFGSAQVSGRTKAWLVSGAHSDPAAVELESRVDARWSSTQPLAAWGGSHTDDNSPEALENNARLSKLGQL